MMRNAVMSGRGMITRNVIARIGSAKEKGFFGAIDSCWKANELELMWLRCGYRWAKSLG